MIEPRLHVISGRPEPGVQYPNSPLCQNHGARCACNAHAFVTNQRRPNNDLLMIQYASGGKANIKDTFGYAAAEVAMMDKDGKGYVTEKDLADAFRPMYGSSSDFAANRLMTALDVASTDGTIKPDGKISAAEWAGFIHFQDRQAPGTNRFLDGVLDPKEVADGFRQVLTNTAGVNRFMRYLFGQ